MPPIDCPRWPFPYKQQSVKSIAEMLTSAPPVKENKTSFASPLDEREFSIRADWTLLRFQFAGAFVPVSELRQLLRRMNRHRSNPTNFVGRNES